MTVIAAGVLSYAVIALGWLRPDSRAVAWGLFLVWAVFTVTYLPRVQRAPLAFGPALLLLAGVLGLRLRGVLRSVP